MEKCEAIRTLNELSQFTNYLIHYYADFTLKLRGESPIPLIVYTPPIENVKDSINYLITTSSNDLFQEIEVLFQNRNLIKQWIKDLEIQIDVILIADQNADINGEVKYIQYFHRLNNEMDLLNKWYEGNIKSKKSKGGNYVHPFRSHISSHIHKDSFVDWLRDMLNNGYEYIIAGIQVAESNEWLMRHPSYASVTEEFGKLKISEKAYSNRFNGTTETRPFITIQVTEEAGKYNFIKTI